MTAARLACGLMAALLKVSSRRNVLRVPAALHKGKRCAAELVPRNMPR